MAHFEYRPSSASVDAGLRFRAACIGVVLVCASACSDSDSAQPLDPQAPIRDANPAEVDRFSSEAGALMVRSSNSELPGANEPVDFDQAPFLGEGLAPDGTLASYYSFDVSVEAVARVYLLVDGDGEPIEHQLPLIEALPGQDGYSDLRAVTRVTVPDDYDANTLTSVSDVEDSGFDLDETNEVWNMPVVPDGSRAAKRHPEATSDELHYAWLDGELAPHFLFDEAPIEAFAGNAPTAYIFVAFNINPDEEGGGPPSGFVAEPNGTTHNVVEFLPGDSGYSPLWKVLVYDSAAAESVTDLESAQAAPVIALPASFVNCPVVEVE